MKIDKLYTLSQFVELIDKSTTIENMDSGYTKEFEKIILYNRFLKQPLKKEMFVNEIDRHLKPLPQDTKPHQYYLDKFQEAEKKVIFDLEQKAKVVFRSNEYEILIAETDVNIVTFYLSKDIYFSHLTVKTIHDLAEKTNGELKLKNVEI